ncbi:MAG: transporter substrate-binding domain-containing protein [Rhodospirillaceae bacterium]
MHQGAANHLLRAGRFVGLVFATFISIISIIESSARAGEAIKIGTYRHYPPWTISDDAGKITGFEIDMINDLCQRMGTKCEITSVDWERVYDELDSKTYDAYIGCMTITQERAKRALFSLPYALTPEYFATLSGNELTSLLILNRLDLDSMNTEEQASFKILMEALRGKRVGVHVDTVYEEFAKQYLAKISDVRVYHVENEKYADMVHGKLDAILDGGAALHEFIIAKNSGGSELTLFGPAMIGGPFGHGVGVAMRPGNEDLRKRFDTAITAAKADGTLARLTLTWFGYNAATE